MVKKQSSSKVAVRRSTRKVEPKNDDKKSVIVTPTKDKVSSTINNLRFMLNFVEKYTHNMLYT